MKIEASINILANIVGMWYVIETEDGAVQRKI